MIRRQTVAQSHGQIKRLGVVHRFEDSTHAHHPERLRELICAECRTREIDVPDDITALIETGFASYETQIYAVVMARLTPEMQSRLDALLVSAPVAEGEEELPLNLLRLDPGPVGVESALPEIAKLRSLRAIGLPADLFQGYTPKLVERLRRRIAAESPSHIREHPHAIRLTLLAALVVQRTQEVADPSTAFLRHLFQDEKWLPRRGEREGIGRRHSRVFAVIRHNYRQNYRQNN